MRMPPNTRFKMGKPALVAAVVAALVSASALAASQHPRVDRQLQENADAAALAGVNAFVAAAGLADRQRADAAESAARAALPDSGVTATAVTSSAAPISVEVTLKRAADGSEVKSVAHYVQPGEAIAPQLSSSLKVGSPAARARL